MLNVLEQLILELASTRPIKKLLGIKTGPNDVVVGLDAQDRLYLGDTINDGGASTPIYLSCNDLARSVYGLGSSGSGKTNAALQLALFAEGKDHLIAADLAGDLLDRILVALAARYSPEDIMRRLYILDQRFPHLLLPWNPLSVDSAGGDAYSCALAALDIVRLVAMSWGPNMEQTGRCCFISLAQAGCSISDAPALLYDRQARARILAGVTDPDCLSFFAALDELKPQRQLEVVAPFANKLSHLLVRPEIRSWLKGPSSLSFSQILNNTHGAIILIGLGSDLVGTHTAQLIGALLLSNIVQCVLGRSSLAENKRRMVRILVDEFQNFANTEALARILYEGRRYKCTLFAFHQNARQLDDALREAFFTNSGIGLFFATDGAQAARIAPNLVTDMPVAELKRILVSQPTGSCMLFRRGQPPVRARIRPYTDPDVSPEMIHALRQASYEYHMRNLSSERPDSVSSPSLSQQGRKPKKEVTHVKRPDTAE